jgi:hypothetical protein
VVNLYWPSGERIVSPDEARGSASVRPATGFYAARAGVPEVSGVIPTHRMPPQLPGCYLLIENTPSDSSKSS